MYCNVLCVCCVLWGGGDGVEVGVCVQKPTSMNLIVFYMYLLHCMLELAMSNYYFQLLNKII